MSKATTTPKAQNRAARGAKPQASELVEHATAMLRSRVGWLRTQHLCALLSCGRTKLFELVQSGRLARPHKDGGANTAYWLPHEIAAFLAQEAA